MKINDKVQYNGLYKPFQDLKGTVLAMYNNNPYNIKVDLQEGEIAVVFPTYSNDFAYIIMSNELERL